MPKKRPPRPWDRKREPSPKQRIREVRRRFRRELRTSPYGKQHRTGGIPLGLVLIAMLVGVALGFVLVGPNGNLKADVIAAPGPAAIIGRASIIDGDTLEIRGERIRFSGVDAPESRQTCEDASGQSYRCGQVAAFALADRIGAQDVVCMPKDQDRYGRTVAKCAVAGEDLGRWLVRNGYAVDYVRYSKGTYAWPQLQARRERLGIWAGRFMNPADWRHSGEGAW